MMYAGNMLMGVLDGIIFILIMKKLLNEKQLIYFKDLIPLITYSLLITVGLIIFPKQYDSLIIGIIIMGIYLLYYKIDFISSLLLTALSMVLMFGILFLSYNLTLLVSGVYNEKFIIELIAKMLGIGLSALCWLFLPFHKLHQFLQRKTLFNEMIKINIITIFSIAQTYFVLLYRGKIMSQYWIVSVSIILVLINTLMVILNLKKVKSNRQQIYQEYLPQIDNLTKDILKKQHDYNNHLHTINMMLAASNGLNDTGNEISKYIDSFKEVQEHSNLLLLKNKVIAGFLYSKIQLLKENEKQLNCFITSDIENTNIPDYEMVEILGILVDNASDATTPGNEINLNIFSDNGHTNIKVENPHPYVTSEQFSEFFKYGYSTKAKTGRGKGLARFSDIIKKHNAEISVYNLEKENKVNHVVFHIIL